MFKKLQTLALSMFVMAITVVPAVAAPTVDDVWAVVDLTTLQGKLIGFMVLLLGATVIVAAYRVGKKVISRMGSIG